MSLLRDDYHHVENNHILHKQIHLECLSSDQNLPIVLHRIVNCWENFHWNFTWIFSNKLFIDFNNTTKLHIKLDRKSTRLNSSHVSISYAVFCLKEKSCVFPFIGSNKLDLNRLIRYAYSE